MKLFKQVLEKNKKILILYLSIGILLTFLELYQVTYYQKILDAFQYQTLTIKPIIIYGILLLILTILGYIDNYPEQKLKHGLYLDFKLQSLRKMKTIDYLEYQKLGTGNLIQKIEEGATSSTNIIMNFYLNVFRKLLPTSLFSLIFIYQVKKELTLFILVGYLFVILITNLILKRLYNLKEDILVNSEYLNKHLVRGFMELVVFRTNKKYDMEIEITESGIKNIVNNKVKIKLVHELFFTLFELLVSILQVLILSFSVLKSNLSVGAVVTIIALIGKSYQPIAIFNVEYVDYKLNKIAVKRYLDFLNLKDDSNLTTGKKLKKFTPTITLKNITYKYPDSKKILINNLNLTIKKYEKLAIVGETGSGKSTIIKLIIGLLKDYQGEILISNENLSNLNLNDLYNNITYISQESPIFDGTLRENIVFDKKISDQEIIKVLKLVSLEKFYQHLENGLDTELGEKGIKMSGGERQRVALARLFFEESSIVILDEATSAMDNITEKEVMTNIMTNSKDKTLIIIAHRLETIKNVDKILVLSNGKIKEGGTYQELLNKKAYFYNLVNSKKWVSQTLTKNVNLHTFFDIYLYFINTIFMIELISDNK